jgi:MoaA/NifB/PqqE/SkfB family radical SAM enzyme
MNKYKQIIDDTKSYIKKVTFFVAGEPFLNKKLCEMINYATKSGLYTFVSTNGTLLNQQRIDELLETKLDVLFVCLDGSKKETHEKYRRKTNFERICNHIQTLTSEKRKRKKIFPHIFIQTLITRYNEDELGDIVNLAKKLGTEGIIFKTFFIEKDYDPIIAKQFIPKRSGLTRYETGDGQIKIKKQIDFKCQYTTKPLILCDGTVAICSYDYNGKYNIGNVFFQNMINLWNSKKYKNLRNAMKRKELKMCKENCGIKKCF